MNGEDVRLIPVRSRSRFLLKGFATVGVIGKVSRQDFDGAFAVEARVTGAIDDAHATATDFVLDGVGTDAARSHRAAL